ncbi:MULTISPECIES: hypothetical protein [unclassified Microbacterium]|uniref:hypothetical protein n=1 Tax=unclassified Microbacterium TaxID=2609290 RepID=UPI0028831045|nr:MULTISPECIES: hypothetical protein [unclassified Microbacterium]
MRVQKTDVIAGLPAPLAREVLRKGVRREIYHAHVAKLFDGLDIDPAAALQALADAGLFEFVQKDQDGDTWWRPTVNGNALAMASFGKPITRATADRLLAGVIERAEGINADPAKIFFVERLRVFGSYLDPEVDPLGDLDIELVLGQYRVPNEVVEAYVKSSGRRFSSYIDKLFWPEREVVQILKNRSGSINITREDIGELTDRVRTVYEFAPTRGPVVL